MAKTLDNRFSQASLESSSLQAKLFAINLVRSPDYKMISEESHKQVLGAFWQSTLTLRPCVAEQCPCFKNVLISCKWTNFHHQPPPASEVGRTCYGSAAIRKWKFGTWGLSSLTHGSHIHRASWWIQPFASSSWAIKIMLVWRSASTISIDWLALHNVDHFLHPSYGIEETRIVQDH